MPQKRNSPPEVMTWGKAVPVLVVAAVFDAIGLLCQMLWFFGPAFAGLICTATASSYVGEPIAGAVCGTSAVAAGIAANAVLMPLGVILGMAVGLFGWLTIGLWLMVSNKRIFKENALWFAGSLLMEEIPLVGALPALTLTVWKMYRTQIRVEKEEFRTFQKEQATQELIERRRQEAVLAQQARAMRLAEEAEQDARMNDEQYEKAA